MSVQSEREKLRIKREKEINTCAVCLSAGLTCRICKRVFPKLYDFCADDNNESYDCEEIVKKWMLSFSDIQAFLEVKKND